MQVRESFQGPLETAGKEVAAEDSAAGKTKELPSPAMVATDVEAALYKLYGAQASGMSSILLLLPYVLVHHALPSAGTAATRNCTAP